MYEVTVEAGFSSGHYLRNYQGKCENPHGHNYKVRVTLAGAELVPVPVTGRGLRDLIGGFAEGLTGGAHLRPARRQLRLSVGHARQCAPSLRCSLP